MRENSIDCEINEMQEREKFGYSFVGEKILSCMGCGKKLLSVIVVKPTDELHRFKCKCPCGSESFSIKMFGKKYYQACEPLSINEINIKGDLVELTFK